MPSLIDVLLVLPFLFIDYKWRVYYAFTAFLFFFFYKWSVYPAVLSPLASIPKAHYLSPWTKLWILWNRYQDREIQTVAEAFEKEGPIVRLGPNEIAVNVIEGGIKAVHNGGYHKSQWYDCFINYGVRNTFSSLGNDHAIRRRRVSHFYSKTYLQNSRHVQAIMSNALQECLPAFKDSARTKTPLDFLSLSFAYSIDFMTAMIFGLPQATAFVKDGEQREDWLALYSESHTSKSMFWMQELPDWTNWLTRMGRPILSKSFQKAREDLESWVLEMVDHAEHDLREIPDEASPVLSACGYLPILYNHLKASLAREDYANGIAEEQQSRSRRRLEVASECLDHIVATRDTFGISMAHVLWEISRHPDAQHHIREELQSHIPENIRPQSPGKGSSAFLLSPATLDQLPYLNAVIKESLRLRRTTPTSNPRLTPENRTTKIGTYDGIPGGVRISAFAWCLHRQESVFTQAEEWNPDRWLSDDQEKLAEMNRWNWTFGSGSRICLGKNLALQLIQSTLAMIYMDFTTIVIDDQHFGQDGSFVTGNKSDKLLIQFEYAKSVLKCGARGTWPAGSRSREASKG